jgi:hypothetical protein
MSGQTRLNGGVPTDPPDDLCEPDHERQLPDNVIDMFAAVRRMCGVYSRPAWPSEDPTRPLAECMALALREARWLLRDAGEAIPDYEKQGREAHHGAGDHQGDDQGDGWDPRQFRRMCREADERARKKPRDLHVEWLRSLFDEDRYPTLDAVYREIQEHHRRQGAAQSTLDAIVYALRRGPTALAEASTRHRLRQLSEAQVVEVGERLRCSWWWTASELRELAKAWKGERR